MRLAVDVARNRRLRQVLAAAVGAVVLLPATAWLFNGSESDAKAALSGRRSGAELPITAVGRIEPKHGVLTIAAPASAETGPAIVTQLHVHQGDWVKQGHALATLRGQAELQALLLGSQHKVALAQARLEAMRSGGKEDDVRALRSEVMSEEAAVALAQAQTRRANQLRDSGLLATDSVEAQQSRLAMAAQSLEAKRARLSGLSSVRPADLAVAAAEVRAAEADVAAIQSKLESTVVRAPADGRVLAVYAQPGQIVGPQGLLAFGRTAEMFIDAEVLEEDLPRTRVGQKVQITGDVLTGTVTGTVAEVGLLVGSREVFSNDPTAFADSRVVHVKIRADNPALLAKFINARVTAVIQP
jgi:HlyD family secretion protein